VPLNRNISAGECPPSHAWGKSPSPPFGGEREGPAKREGEVGGAASTGSSAPLALPSPPGRRGARVKAAALAGNFSRKISERLSLNFPRTNLSTAGEGGERSEARESAASRRRRPIGLTHRLHGWGAALCFGFFGLLPLDWASAIGGALARTIGPRLGISKRARLNIGRALPELSQAEVARIIAGMWDNLGRVAAEYPHLQGIRIFEPGGHVETHGFEHIDRAVATGRRMIIFSGHIANWEIGMLAAVQYGIEVAQIYRAANNPLIDRMITRFRGIGGELIPKGTVAARRAIAVLHRGAHVTMLADQKMNDGIPVPFFGRPAMTASALAALALRFDCDVLPARVERLGGARFRLTVFPPLPLPRSGDHHADVATLMTRVNQTLEGWIRDRPQEWFWVHRRWPD
jgi:KDO2-lipid IV(A) lauroyltransferase